VLEGGRRVPARFGLISLGLFKVYNELPYQLGAELNVGAAADLNPAVTERTRLGDMAPATALDFTSDITFRNGTRTGTVTPTPGMTVGEFAEAVRRLDLGLRVEVNESGDSINIGNEVSGLRMAVEEGGGEAATRLGIRTLKSTTPLSQFNDGRGVEIAHGEVDETGAPDPNRNVDFEITLSDGTSFTVDLEPADVTDVGSVLTKILAEAAGAGLALPGDFSANFSSGPNGIVLQDNLGGPDPIEVRSLNGYAAEDLGLLSGTSSPGTPAVLTGEDRATVRVDSLFTTLVDLRESLASDDQRGITFAGERLEADLDRLTVARAQVGGRTQRIEASQQRLEDRTVLDESIKSDLQDLDLYEASTRFNLLQVQLQATLAAAAQTTPLSLLNFL